VFNRNSEKVIEPGKSLYEDIKGKWRELQFKNENPIVLELACGRGEYTIGFARGKPDSNFIGIDIKGSRLWAGAKIADADNLRNAAFLRIQMHQLDDFFAPNEVDEIWIIHPDPRPKKRDIRRRLTNPRYLDQYKNILKPGAQLHLKTDNTLFFDYTLEVLHNRSDVFDLASTYDLDNSTFLPEHLGIKTRYELMFREEGEKIKYLKFRFR